MDAPDPGLESQALELERKRLELAELRRKGGSLSRLATPITPTLFGLFAAAIGGLFQLNANRNLERDKFEYQILTKATDLKTDGERRQYLDFVSKLGLIERRASSVKAWLASSEPVPRTVADGSAANPIYGPLSVSPALLREVMPGVHQAERFAKPLEEAMGQNGIVTPRRAAAFLANVAYMTGELDERNLSEKLPAGASGERVRYRGRGLIPFGGRAEYVRIGKGIDVDLENDPDRMADPGVASKAAAFWWKSKGLNEMAEADNFGGVVYVEIERS